MASTTSRLRGRAANNGGDDMSDGTADAAKQHPPKPRFALTVGVVGHKQKFWTKEERGEDTCKDKGEKETAPQLSPEEQLRNVTADVAAALAAIEAAARQSAKDHGHHFADKRQDGKDAPEPLLVTLVSALADGADTIAADAALALGYGLDAPLPFAREEYARDFETPERRAHYHRLLDRIDRLAREQRGHCLELPGRRQSDTGNEADDRIETNRAYEAAGLTVLSQADIVLAVWDRKPPRGRAGTAEMVAEAARAGMPLVIVDAKGVLPVEVRWRGLEDNPAPIVAVDDLPRQPLQDAIHEVVDELVRLPASWEQKVGYARWQREKRHRFNLSFAFPALMACLFARLPKRADVMPKPPENLAEDYIRDANPVMGADAETSVAALAAPYGWADGVGFHYAQVFRSAFVTNFFFAAFAVMFALVSVFFLVADAGAPEQYAVLSLHHLPVVVELILIVSVVVLTMVGRWRQWHHRWVEAREVAERLRGALPLWALGLRPGFFPGEEATWTGWYTRAVVRMQGLRSGRIVAGKPWPERQLLLQLLQGQARYNENNVVRMRKAERRLEWIGFIFFIATVAVAVDHLFGSRVLACLLHHWDMTPEAAVWLSAALPSLATATYGIRIIGDFEGTVHRNEHTARSIKKLVAAIEQDPPEFGLLRARARTAADILLGDVQSWRLAAESRGLAIPG